MRADYKDLIQDRAEELAWELHDTAYEDLPDDVRQVVYERAYGEVGETYW